SVVGRYGATLVPSLSRDVPPNRATPISPPICHCDQSDTGAPAVNATATSVAVRACIRPSAVSSSLHLQVDPAVGHVVLALHDPVVPGVRNAHHDVFHGVAHDFVVRIDERRQRGPKLLESVGMLV